MTGTNATISVPSGTSHDSWTSGIKAARLLQAAPSGDFGVETKFNSVPSVKYQMQGIVVQEDDNTILRFEVFHDGTSPKVFAAFVDADNSTANILINITPSPAIAPSYLRVERAGNLWTLSYSFDNSTVDCCWHIYKSIKCYRSWCLWCKSHTKSSIYC